jgi:uncharacterized protein YndB with AHSA1/START domain
MVTVSYEQARGMRLPGQRPNGFEVSAAKSIGVPVERLYASFVDETLRQRWLPGVTMRLRTATAPRSARFDWEDGSTRVAASFTRLSDGKSSVALSHTQLPDVDAAKRMKTWWRERVAALKALLEQR